MWGRHKFGLGAATMRCQETSDDHGINSESCPEENVGNLSVCSAAEDEQKLTALSENFESFVLARLR